MTIHVSFPGGKRIDARVGAHVMRTDQSVEHGGEGSAPEPFDLFLASIAACAGAYVLGFCQARGISTTGIQLTQRHRFDEVTKKLECVELEIVLPPTFPQKYRVAIERAAAGCKVKKALASPPEITIVAKFDDTAATREPEPSP